MNFLKNLFGSTQPRINSLKFDSRGWIEGEKTPSKHSWQHPQYSAFLSLNYFDLPPDIPTQPEDVQNLRPFYRANIKQHYGGLVEVSHISIQHIASIRTIFKFPMQPTGMTYVGSLTIPFKNCSFVIKMQAQEEGMTGMREAVMADKLMREGTISLGDTGMTGWLADPYDTSLTEGTLMNASEREEYDDIFAEHPLSLVRTNLRAFERSIYLEKELVKAEKF